MSFAATLCLLLAFVFIQSKAFFHPTVHIRNIAVYSNNVGRINEKIGHTDGTVKDEVAVSVGKKIAVCRCWKSDKFPYCDGHHNQHNTETGDNVGPCIVTGK